ncbi:BQ5605_C018g08801 [Microbotryum silenes-dioicae]|uniref:BQ5605_C018g08801 protein n=1 Tax=Microbotryum silenes-dioicae TaxID=796604 RepID=A0A2X0NUU7_9BASI|nr:BQ5605_C018g08801 [Microbotryum silenes-dioicae]
MSRTKCSRKRMCRVPETQTGSWATAAAASLSVKILGLRCEESTLRSAQDLGARSEPGADLGARSEPGAPAQDLGAQSEAGT